MEAAAGTKAYRWQWLMVVLAVVVTAPLAGLAVRALWISVGEVMGSEAGEWSVGDFAVRVGVPAGLVVGAVLGILGTVRRKRGMVAAGAGVMPVETVLVFTIAPLVLVSGVVLAGIAYKMGGEKTGESGRG